MFLEDVFLETAKSDLDVVVSQTHTAPRDDPFPWDPYIAKSLLQKSIRRGDTCNALWAAGTLLQANERSFWKRLCIIALEDIGVANPTLVAQVLLLEKDRALRNHLGGPQHVGPALVSALCSSPKDRSTDDLIDAIATAPEYDWLKAEVADSSPEELFEMIRSTISPIQTRAIAAVHLTIGFDAFPTDANTHAWYQVLDELPEDVLCPSYKVTASLGLQRTRSIMAPLLALISRDTPHQPNFADDKFPACTDLMGLPSWVLDGHTRLGLQSFRMYLKRSVRMSGFLQRWSTRAVSPAKAVAGLVFRTESAQLARRLDWDTAQELKREACANRPGIRSGASAEGLGIIREEFDLLNECRLSAAKLYRRQSLALGG